MSEVPFSKTSLNEAKIIVTGWYKNPHPKEKENIKDKITQN